MELEQKNPNNKTDYFLILTITIILTIFVIILIVSYFFPGVLQKNTPMQTPALPENNVSASPDETITQTSIPTSQYSPSSNATNQKTYKENSWGFIFEYPADYQTVNDTYGWPHAIVHLMPLSGGQSYEGQIEWWDTQDQFKATYQTDPKFIIAHPNNKNWITINYYADPNGIWEDLIDSFKFQ